MVAGFALRVGGVGEVGFAFCLTFSVIVIDSLHAGHFPVLPIIDTGTFNDLPHLQVKVIWVMISVYRGEMN